MIETMATRRRGRPTTTVAAAAVALIVALVLAGCGSGAKRSGGATGSTANAAPTTVAPTSSTGPVTPEQAAFRSQANAICTASNAEIKAASASITDQSTNAEKADGLAHNASIVESMVTKIRALPQPSADAAGLATFYTGTDQLATLAQHLSAALRAGDQKTASSLADQGDPLNRQVDTAAHQVGIDSCAPGSSAS
jgi:hypothetical protein